MYHLVTGRSLFLADNNDNLDAEELSKLAEWTLASQRRYLDRVDQKPMRGKLARELMVRLLHPVMGSRPSMQDVMLHQFFQDDPHQAMLPCVRSLVRCSHQADGFQPASVSVVVCDPTGERASAFCSALAGWCNVLSESLRHKTRSSSCNKADSSIEIQRDGIEHQVGGFVGADLARAPEPPLLPLQTAALTRAAFLYVSPDADCSKASSKTSSADKDPEPKSLDTVVPLPSLVSGSFGYSSSFTECERATKGLPDDWVANPRVAALCVGIDRFHDGGLPNLENCCNDARAMAAQFRTLPLSTSIVQLGENVDLATFVGMTSEFQDRISATAKHLEVVVVFLASHGFQFGTKLYLATADTVSASIDRMHEFRDKGSEVSRNVDHWLQGNCIDVDHVISVLRSTWSGPLAIIVDACRTAPIAELAFKPSELTNSVSYANRTLVCLSTASYTAAADGCGEGGHSPFCIALLESMFCVGVPLIMSVNKACSSLGVLQQPMLASIQFPDIQLIPRLCQIYFLHANDETNAADFAWIIASVKRARYRLTTHHPEDIIVVCSGSLDLTLMTVLLELKVELLHWSSEPEKNTEVLARVVRMWEMCSLRRG
jgi:hypothetical protein